MRLPQRVKQGVGWHYQPHRAYWSVNVRMVEVLNAKQIKSGRIVVGPLDYNMDANKPFGANKSLNSARLSCTEYFKIPGRDVGIWFSQRGYKSIFIYGGVKYVVDSVTERRSMEGLDRLRERVFYNANTAGRLWDGTCRRATVDRTLRLRRVALPAKCRRWINKHVEDFMNTRHTARAI